MAVRLGLVGAGAWGRNYLKTSSGSPDLTVSCVCRSRTVPVDGFSEVPVTDDLGELLNSCDAVVVATPPSSHESVVMRALAAGKPVLLEKPAALSATAVDRMLAAAEAAHVPFLVGHIHLFSPAFVALRAWTRSWRARSVLSTAGGYGPFRDYPSLWDWGPHDVSMCLALFGKPPDDVEAVRYNHSPGVVDVLSLGFGESRAVLRFGNGMASKVRRFSVSSPDGDASYDDTSGPVLTFLGSPSSLPSVAPLKAILDSFVAAVEGGPTDWRYDPWLALETAKVLDLADHVISIRTDRFLPEA
jgi:predicted dehydrogenase